MWSQSAIRSFSNRRRRSVTVLVRLKIAIPHQIGEGTRRRFCSCQCGQPDSVDVSVRGAREYLQFFIEIFRGLLFLRQSRPSKSRITKQNQSLPWQTWRRRRRPNCDLIASTGRVGGAWSTPKGGKCDEKCHFVLGLFLVWFFKLHSLTLLSVCFDFCFAVCVSMVQLGFTAWRHLTACVNQMWTLHASCQNSNLSTESAYNRINESCDKFVSTVKYCYSETSEVWQTCVVEYDNTINQFVLIFLRLEKTCPVAPMDQVQCHRRLYLGILTKVDQDNDVKKN